MMIPVPILQGCIRRVGAEPPGSGRAPAQYRQLQGIVGIGQFLVKLLLARLDPDPDLWPDRGPGQHAASGYSAYRSYGTAQHQ